MVGKEERWGKRWWWWRLRRVSGWGSSRRRFEWCGERRREKKKREREGEGRMEWKGSQVSCGAVGEGRNEARQSDLAGAGSASHELEWRESSRGPVARACTGRGVMKARQLTECTSPRTKPRICRRWGEAYLALSAFVARIRPVALLLLAVTRLYCFSSARGEGEGDLGFCQYPDRIAARIRVVCRSRRTRFSSFVTRVYPFQEAKFHPVNSVRVSVRDAWDVSFRLIIADVYASVYSLFDKGVRVGGKGRGKEDFSFLLSNESRHANFSWRDTLLLTYRFGWHGARSFGIESWWRSREGKHLREEEKRKKRKKRKVRKLVSVSGHSARMKILKRSFFRFHVDNHRRLGGLACFTLTLKRWTYWHVSADISHHRIEKRGISTYTRYYLLFFVIVTIIPYTTLHVRFLFDFVFSVPDDDRFETRME